MSSLFYHDRFTPSHTTMCFLNLLNNRKILFLVAFSLIALCFGDVKTHACRSSYDTSLFSFMAEDQEKGRRVLRAFRVVTRFNALLDPEHQFMISKLGIGFITGTVYETPSDAFDDNDANFNAPHLYESTCYEIPAGTSSLFFKPALKQIVLMWFKNQGIEIDSNSDTITEDTITDRINQIQDVHLVNGVQDSLKPHDDGTFDGLVLALDTVFGIYTDTDLIHALLLMSSNLKSVLFDQSVLLDHKKLPPLDPSSYAHFALAQNGSSTEE